MGWYSKERERGFLDSFGFISRRLESIQFNGGTINNNNNKTKLEF